MGIDVSSTLVDPSRDTETILPEPQTPAGGENNTPAEQLVPASTTESTLGVQAVPAEEASRSATATPEVSVPSSVTTQGKKRKRK